VATTKPQSAAFSSRQAVSRSFVVAPQWIGDAVMTEPLLRRLHARGERITVGALPWVAPVYRCMPQVAEVIELPFAHGGLQLKARRSIAQQIAGNFDAAYVLPNSLKSALLPLLAGIPKRVGYLGEARVGLLTHRLKNPPKNHGKDGRPPMVAFYSALSGDTDVASDRPQLQVDDATVNATLATLGLQRGQYAIFVPSAEYGPAKRWPVQHFARLAQMLDVPVLLFGSAKDAALCDEIVALAPEKTTNWAGKTSLVQAIHAQAASKIIVTNDSGLMHVAAALDLPQVAIFGSSSPLHTPPLSAAAQIIWLKNEPSYQPALDCAPCFERTCPLGHTRCLHDVTPEMVLSRAQAAMMRA
jgi:heptosyltransferase II